jgi:hypothetical protein
MTLVTTNIFKIQIVQYDRYNKMCLHIKLDIILIFLFIKMDIKFVIFIPLNFVSVIINSKKLKKYIQFDQCIS